MGLDLVGLASAVAVWAAALRLALHERRRLIAALPADWRHDPELESLYDRAVGARVDLGSWLRPPGLYTAATAIAWFVLIRALGVGLGRTLLFAGLLAVVFTAGARERNRRWIENVVAEGHSVPPHVPRARSLVYWSAQLTVNAGFLAAACFAGRLLVRPFT